MVVVCEPFCKVKNARENLRLARLKPLHQEGKLATLNSPETVTPVLRRMTSLAKNTTNFLYLLFIAITLSACGGGGGSSTSTPLVADFTVDDASPKKTQEVIFNAAASSGGITSYSWDFGDNSTAIGQTVNHSYTTDGSHTVVLTIADSSGNTATKSLTVEVSGQLTTPEAQFTAPTPKAAIQASFDGSASSDADGSITAYAWNFGDGNTGTGATATHTFSTAGNYEVSLTVTDDDGLTDTISQTVSVGPENVAPVAQFTGTTEPNLQVLLDATTSTDADGNITEYAWSITDSNGTHEKTGQSLTHTFATQGNYQVTLTVTDNNGATHSTTNTVAAADEVAQILTIGDSITHGDSGHGTYRYELWKKLVDTGKFFDLIGTETNNFGGNFNYPDYNGKQFDRNHQAAWGQAAGWFLMDGALNNWLNSYTPDIAIIHIGTNDVILQGDTTGQAANDIADIINLLRGDNANVKILVAKIIPVSTENTFVDAAEVAHIDTLNAAIETTIAPMSTAQSPIVIVDQNTGFDATRDVDTHDGVHPNSVGEAKMAQKWFDALTTNNFF